MGITRREYRTNIRLWALCSGAVLGLLGFIDPLPGAKTNPGPLWDQVATILTGDYAGGLAHRIPEALIHTAVLAIPAALMGWLLHALIITLTAALRGSANSSQRSCGIEPPPKRL
jgi:hypothetical protein